MKPRMKFVGRRGSELVWESVEPITPEDSRHERITAVASWFYGTMTATPYGRTSEGLEG